MSSASSRIVSLGQAKRWKEKSFEKEKGEKEICQIRKKEKKRKKNQIPDRKTHSMAGTVGD